MGRFSGCLLFERTMPTSAADNDRDQPPIPVGCHFTATPYQPKTSAGLWVRRRLTRLRIYKKGSVYAYQPQLVDEVHLSHHQLWLIISAAREPVVCIAFEGTSLDSETVSSFAQGGESFRFPSGLRAQLM